MGIKVNHKGNFNHLEKFLDRVKHRDTYRALDAYGKIGDILLKDATPTDSGETANSWTHEIDRTRTGYTLGWNNTNTNQGIPIAILIQYGHGTGTGGYVPPTDFINPVMDPYRDSIIEDIWEEVKNS